MPRARRSRRILARRATGSRGRPWAPASSRPYARSLRPRRIRPSAAHFVEMAVEESDEPVPGLHRGFGAVTLQRRIHIGVAGAGIDVEIDGTGAACLELGPQPERLLGRDRLVAIAKMKLKRALDPAGQIEARLVLPVD